MELKKIKIKDLKLWDENPRFPEEYFKKSEKELINYLFNKKGEKDKLKDLAKSIIENINLIPWERLIVYNNQDEYIVLEGNRRLIVYKLLLNPNLLGNKRLSEIFKNEKGIINENLELDCIVTENIEEGLKYVGLKHLEAGYKGWGEPERNNFMKRRGCKKEEITIKTEIDKIVKELDIPREIKEKILGHGFVTSFYRVIAASPAKEYFKYEIQDEKLKIKDNDFKDKLKVIIWNILNKRAYIELFDEQKEANKDKLNSRTLNKVENIKKYLESIDKKAIQQAKKEIKKSIREESNLFGERERTIRTNHGSLRRTPRTQQVIEQLFGGTLSLKKGDVNDIYRDILDLYRYYLDNRRELSPSFPSLIRMALRLLVESATAERESINQYVNANYQKAKILLNNNQKTTLANNSINGKKSLIKLLQSGAHNYTNSANFKQTIAMSIIIGAMLKTTHLKIKGE